MIPTAIVILILFTSLIYYWLTKRWNYWEDQGIPYIKPNFPFGNISNVILMRKTVGEVYRDIYRQFPGLPAGGFFKFGEPMLILRDPDLIKIVMIKEFAKFQNNDFTVSKDVDPLLAINPFTLPGPEWKSVRTIQLPAQKMSKIKIMVPEMIKCSENMIEHIDINLNTGIEAKTMCSGYTGDTVATCAFGLYSNSFSKNEKEKFAAVTEGEMFCSNYLDNFSILCAMFAPSIGKFFKLKIIHKEVENYFIKVINSAAQFRLKNCVQRNDFLQQLIETNKQSTTGKPVYNEIEMAGHCMTFYIDGYETTSIVLSFTLYELAANPQIQEELRREIFSISKNIQDFDLDKIQQMKYLDNVISECLRLHPPIQSVTRICTESTTLHCNGQEYKIKKGMSIVIPIYALHTDPENFSEPEVFEPNRFSEENKSSIRKFTYIPYGEGPRICLGVKFSLAQIKLAVISILQRFKVHLWDKHKGPIKLDPLSTFLHIAQNGIWLRYERL